jgi:hypothetical protein
MSIASLTLAKVGAAPIRATSFRSLAAGPGSISGFQFDNIKSI